MVTWINLIDDSTGDTDPIVEFLGDHWFLSNFYPSVVTLDGEVYTTVEHAYQAAKTLDINERKRIQEQLYPAAAKRIGKTVNIRDDWEQVKESVMRQLLEEKFAFGRPECIMLCNTGSRALIEGNTWGDTYWGVCRGRGLNRLGEILMSIRNDRECHTTCQSNQMDLICDSSFASS